MSQPSRSPHSSHGKGRRRSQSPASAARAAAYEPTVLRDAEVLGALPAPSNLRVIDGDITLATEDVIGHQCNCTSKKGRGLADVLFKQFPFADVYLERRTGMGTVIIRGDGVTQKPRIANLFAQYAGGRPKLKKGDTAMARLLWFRQSLDALARQIPGPFSLALPYLIGCGLAGGQWPVYWAELVRFAQRQPQISITVYRLPGVAAAEAGSEEDGGDAAAAAATPH